MLVQRPWGKEQGRWGAKNTPMGQDLGIVRRSLVASAVLVTLLAPGTGFTDGEYEGVLVYRSPISDHAIPGVGVPVVIRVRNTGSAAWPTNGFVRLGTAGPRNHHSRFCAADWESCSRPSGIDANASDLRKDRVDPGEEALLTFTFLYPSDEEPLEPVFERFEMVADLPQGDVWFCCLTGVGFSVDG